MGQIFKGILGGFSGKVGTVVGANWRGMDIIRSMPKKSDRTPTQSQLEQRMKFALVTPFLAQVRPIIAAFFGQRQAEKSRRNLATSYHLQEAISGVYPDFAIDYVKVILTKGELLNAENPLATPQAGAQIEFTWDDNSGQGMATATDGLLLAVYNETRNLWAMQEDAALRSVGTYTQSLPAAWTGETVHVYFTFVSSDARKCANSVYLGALLLL